ncbi:MAG: class I SAM-dependent methyltransferase [Chlamydiae bacterium]|nr:class I SAM-dependent methyltransferase [Chlamydiota bacterium]
MIERARKTASNCSFCVMDIESLAFPQDTFDGAWANASLLHIPKKNIPSILKKIYAILKPNGALFVSVKQNSLDEILAPDSRYEGLEKYWSFFKQSELENFLSNSGFKIIDLEICNKKIDYQTHSLINVFAKNNNLIGEK